MNHEGLPIYQSEFLQTHTALSALENVFAKELSAPMAYTYMKTLIHAIGGADQSYGGIVEKGNALHEHVGKDIYGPLIVGYCQWVHAKCGEIGHTGVVHMALRDAAPMEKVAEVVWKGTELTPHGVYVNRPILGIEDEISVDHTGPDEHILQYLAQHGIHPNGTLVLCDSGAWGTVVKEMKEKLLPQTQFFPLFWFSHNPHIPGYINGLLGEVGESEEMGEIINDSIECTFPQCVERPTHTETVPSGVIDVVLRPNTALAVAWGEHALHGVVQAANAYHEGISHQEELQALQHIIDLSQQAKQIGLWTGVLPAHTPTWSHGQTFLSEWPAHLLP